MFIQVLTDLKYIEKSISHESVEARRWWWVNLIIVIRIIPVITETCRGE